MEVNDENDKWMESVSVNPNFTHLTRELLQVLGTFTAQQRELLQVIFFFFALFNQQSNVT